MGDERFLTTLSRTTIVAALLALVLLLVLPSRGGVLWDFVDVFTVAFCFTFLGHYVDALLLTIPEIEFGVGRLIRMLGWFAGGLWCYVVARWLWVRYGRDLQELPGLLWGGVIFICLELVAHAWIKARGRRSFFG